MQGRFHSLVFHQYSTLIRQVVYSNKICNRSVVLSYKVLGEGVTEEPPIFLLHGLLENKKLWESIGKIIFNLTKRSVVAVDLRNHGDSPQVNSHKYEDMASDLLNLFKKLGVEQASLLGHSMGGKAAMCLALISPLKIAGILVVDISPVSTSVHYRDEYPQILTAMKAVDFKNARKENHAKKEAENQLKTVITDNYLLNNIIANIKEKTDQTIGWTVNIDVLLKHIPYIANFPKSMKGKKYFGPTLFVGGQLSELIPPDDLTYIRHYFPRAVITYIPKTRHYVHIDDPTSFLELTISFIRTHHYKRHFKPPALLNGMDIFNITVRKIGIKCQHLMKPIYNQRTNAVVREKCTAINVAHRIHGPSPSPGSLPIIVLHGCLGSKKNWEKICNYITVSTYKTVIAVDARNHGDSPYTANHNYHSLAADVSKLMSKFSIEQSIIIGHSMGGKTGMVLALTEPSKVASLVVVDTSPVSIPGTLADEYPKIMKAMTTVDFKGMDLESARDLAKNKMMQHNLFHSEHDLQNILVNIGKLADKSIGWKYNLKTLMNTVDDIISFPNMFGRTYKGPTLFVAGRLSYAIPPEDLRGIRKLFPGACLVYVEGVGHHVHAEDPNTFLDTITQFLSDNSKIQTIQKQYSLKQIIRTRASVVDLAHKIHGPGLTPDSEPILVLHGLLGSSRNWQSMCKKITEYTNKPVVAVDARNHGDSPHSDAHSYLDLAADVSQLMTKLQIKRASIIGHSMGGRTGMALALAEPSRVANLVVVDISPVRKRTSTLSVFFPKLMETMKSVDFKGSDTLNKAKNAAKSKMVESQLFQSDQEMYFILMNIGQLPDKSFGWKCNVEAIANNFTKIASFPNLAGKIYNGPTLFIGSKLSSFILPEDITPIRKLFPKAQLVYIEGAGHNVHHDQPSAFFDTVVQRQIPARQQKNMATEEYSDAHGVITSKSDVATISLPARLPPFWRQNPRLWFAQFEAAVAASKIGEEQKFNLVMLAAMADKMMEHFEPASINAVSTAATCQENLQISLLSKQIEKLSLEIAELRTNQQNYQPTSENAEAVDLAYASYESTSSQKSAERPPLVILHGLLGSKNNWNSMSKAIHRTTGRKVISVDARNHGDSRHASQHTYIHMAHDVMKLLKKLELSKVSILGHSMGGRTAMVLSLLCSDMVSSLIVVDISPVKTSPQIFSMANLFDAMTSVSIRPGIAMSKARKLADEQLKMITPDVNLRNFLITNLVQTNSGSYTWRVNISALKDNFQSHISCFPSNLRGLQYCGPTLFVGGSLSDYIGKNDLKEIQEYFPLAELVFIDGAGHWVHSQKPEQFLETVCKFLKEK
ncbi:hypothetical protein HW555_012343 [Spodoptera exigua]|uniref:sn-1-specific diacylglycerol lipase ABHD11 n=1 Tax=Spodoptera exigua TaxID=7107 RepID=A0A835KZQ2_SPOEX|nr:hypothetical protein HW555_012343 [Spodoptera exigua]